MNVWTSLGVIHAPHAPDREEMLDRLLHRLHPLPKRVLPLCVHQELEPPRMWARRAWQWALSTSADFHVVINDDVNAPPIFWPALSAMLEHLPPRTVLGLATVSPAQTEWHARGERWLTDGHGVVGWAYGMWREDMQLLVDEEAKLPPDHRSPGHDECKPDCPHWHEDSWMTETLSKHGRSVWHPIPSIVQHDTTLASMYGNDHHKTRRAPVTWEQFTDEQVCSPDFWRPR
jgi:hypothetical protein